MKQRLLIMNGQRLVQTEQDGQWSTVKVEKAESVKPGIYHLSEASFPSAGKTYAGPIIHIDSMHVYQSVGKFLVKHYRASFDKAPDVGMASEVAYVEGKAVLSPSSAKRGRRI